MTLQFLWGFSLAIEHSLAQFELRPLAAGDFADYEDCWISGRGYDHEQDPNGRRCFAGVRNRDRLV